MLRPAKAASGLPLAEQPLLLLEATALTGCAILDRGSARHGRAMARLKVLQELLAPVWPAYGLRAQAGALLVKAVGAAGLSGGERSRFPNPSDAHVAEALRNSTRRRVGGRPKTRKFD